MPSSLHSVYFEGKKVPSTNIKPVGGKAGDVLYTDINGQAQFTFYYQSDVIATSSADRYNEIAQRVGGSKELAVVNSTDEQLPDNYEEAYTSYGRKNIVFKTTKISELPVKTNYSFAYPPNAIEVVQELKYINVVKGYFPKFLDTTEDEYLRKVNACQLLKQREAIDRAWNYIRKAKQNDITRKMAEPLTLEELKELIALPSFEHTDKYMRKILNTVYNKRVRDNKCVLMWLCGSASAGKSVMMEILGYIFGPSHGLDKSQIWKDILAMDAPAKKNARCLTFEEFNISEVDSEKKKVAQPSSRNSQVDE